MERPFVRYVANQPGEVRNHFYVLREAVPQLRGMALFDRLESGRPDVAHVAVRMWRRREIENYLCSRATLEAYAAGSARVDVPGPLFAKTEAEKRLRAMRESIEKIEAALRTLGSKGMPWDPDIKASDDFLVPLFRAYFGKLGLPNLMQEEELLRIG